MKRILWVLALVTLSAAGVSELGVQIATRTSAQQGGDPGISDSVREQIAAVMDLKHNFTAAEQKLDSSLVFAEKTYTGEMAATQALSTYAASAVDVTLGENVTSLLSDVTVDIYGEPSATIVDAVTAVGGTVRYASDRWGMVHASVPLGAVKIVAESAAVKSIQRSVGASTNIGALTSQGYVSHSAKEVVTGLGYTGTGVTVGVISDSASAARISALQTSGDLPPGARTGVILGQSGSGSDEGAAMMEIVYDIAPGVNLLFATALPNVAAFANNILALQNAGAKVIVDDISYFNEGAFQDGPIAQAVNTVTANGALYFSSAANSGSVTRGTSGTWEGDFLDGGPSTPPITTAEGQVVRLHNFGTVLTPQNFDVLTGATVPQRISLKWSDPLGASANDYDVFVTNSTGTVIKAGSAAAQTGTQDPFEFIVGVTSGANQILPGDRVVVVLYSGVQRALRVDTHRGRLSINTTGSTYGHNAGMNTVSMAATYWNSAKTGTKPFTGAPNINEVFSSDGPRRIFYLPNGTPITPGNILFGTNGGTVLQKPDFAAADGGSTKTPGFNPFFGTSAASPHAAGIAALVWSARPTYTNAQVYNAMKQTALDSMAVGTDRDAGYGIVMALAAVQYALAH